jgi:hypothetical protein
MGSDARRNSVRRTSNTMINKLTKPRFTLRTLFVVLTISAVWLGYYTNEARRQRIAVEAIQASGGRVRYDDQRTLANGKDRGATSLGSSWIGRLLGDDYFRRVVEVDWSRKQGFEPNELRLLKNFSKLESVNLNFSEVNDSDLLHIADLRQLKSVQLEKCHDITDEGLSHLSRLSNLEHLSLLATSCSDDGVRRYVLMLPKLQHLDLAGISVTNDTATQLCQLKDLRFVHLGRVGHRATFDLRDAVALIKTTLPKCTVNYWGPKTEE